MDYRQHLSFDDFKQYLLNANDETEKKSGYNPNRKNATDLFMESQSSSFINFLQDAVKEYHLGAIRHSETHTSNFPTMWNNFLDNPQDIKDYEVNFILHNLLQPLLFEASYYREKETVTEDSIVNRYEHLIERLNNGNFTDDSPLSSITMTEHYCFDCGVKMKLFFEHWEPEFKVFEKIDGKYDYRAPKPCIDDNIHTLTIEIKGNELLAADWFRIPAFTTATDTNYKFDINSAKGQIDEARHILEQHNVIKISMGNMVPHIFMNGDRFVAGYENDEENIKHDFTDLGAVCCDLWAVTLVEPDTLVKIVAKQDNISEDKAREVVQQYLDENDYIVRIPVQPGQYNIHIANNYEDFEQKAQEDETLAWNTDGIRPFFMIEKALPKKEHKLKM
jgi:hypothetical protein